MTDIINRNLLEDTNSLRMIQNTYRQAKKRLLLLDYDGTLQPLAPTPDQAKPSPSLSRLLKRLVGDPHNTVVVISGRRKDTLDAWLGDTGALFIAEHGAFAKQKAGEWQNLIGTETAWKQAVRRVLEAGASKVERSFVEEKQVGIVWHHGLSDPKVAAAEEPKVLAALAPLTKKYGLTAVSNGKNVEVKIRGANKGKAAAPWLAKSWDFVLAAGDEPTDEDLFKVMPSGTYSIKVGPGPTAARFGVPSAASFIQLLSSLTTRP